MSVFVKSLKTFASGVTGKKRRYKINNAVWLFLKSDFQLTQTEWAKGYDEETVLYGAKFITSVLKANGIDTTEQEVLENTDSMDIMEFVVAYQEAMIKDESADDDDVEEDSKGK